MGKITISLLLVFIFLNGFSQEIVFNKPVSFLALGDSYTIGQSVDEKLRWPNQLANLLEQKGTTVENLDIIATTGWRSDNLIEAINSFENEKQYNLVGLLIGVNDQYQGRDISDYENSFIKLLNIAIDFAGNRNNVFVLSIPDYAYTPFGQLYNNPENITIAINEFNQVNRSFSEKYQVKYIDVTGISRNGLQNPELVAEDGLHPSGEMYALWVNKILQEIKFTYNPSTAHFESIQLKNEIIIHKDFIKLSDAVLNNYDILRLIQNNGQVVFTSPIKENLQRINGIAPGIYFLQLINYSSGEHRTVKLAVN